ncbi:DMT family transporter [bacterium]|nr:DMT family transporter [bacterium]
MTCICWGLNFVITKSATGSDPGTFRIFIFNIIRFPAASALLFLTAKIRHEKVLFRGKDMAAVALLSFLGTFLYQILYMIGQTHTSSANVGIVYGFSPLLILGISVLAKIERPTVFTIAGVIMGFSGLCIILFHGGSRLTVDRGSFLMLLAIACWASYSVFGKPIVDRYPPVTTTAWILLFGALYQLPLALWQLPDQQWALLSGTSILFVALSAFFSLYIGYTLFYYSIARIGPAKAGVYTNLTPVFTLIFAALIRNEKISFLQVFGLSIIVIGIGITKIRRREKSL